MFFFDPWYLIISLPALVLAMYAQWQVQSTVSKYSQVHTGRGATGARVARALLDSYGLTHVEVERAQGFLGDHYDPTSRTLRLSPDVYDTPSVSAVGIAAHETGHALQHAEGYWPLQARSAIVPAVQFGSFLGPLVFLVGMLFLGPQVAWLGVILFSAVVVFALVTLPAEFDASRRAKEVLASAGFAVGDELTGVSRVLDAAALTYVAGLAQALTTLLYYIFILTGARRRD